MENKIERLLEKSIKNQNEIIKLLKQAVKNQNKSIFDEISQGADVGSEAE